MAPRPAAAKPGFPTYDMGPPLIDNTKALRLAGELEDQELIVRLACGA